MANYLFQDIVKNGYKTTGLQIGSKQAIDWFRDKALQVSKVNIQNEMKNEAQLVNKLVPGEMYHFFYDAKTKETLPYWDKFPLIFVVNMHPGGFMGINLHYLPHIYRARLMDALYTIAIGEERKKIPLSYKLLNSAAKFKYFQPCLKQYLNDHVRSRFLKIPSDQWDLALMLPTERFVKSKKQAVWNDSKRILT